MKLACYPRRRGYAPTHWRLQLGLGIGHVPSGDASLYDHVLDTACMFGAIPPGYGWHGGPVSLRNLFRTGTRLSRHRGRGRSGDR